MEIVTEPNIGSGLEAASLVKELHFMLKSTGICLGHMERGHMRVDANVSLADKKHPELGLGVRTEVKNINSFKFVQRAVEFELQRHRQLIEAEREVVGETRVYDYKTGMTTGMRDKEVWLDYRFMPEPNLPPLRVFDSENGPHPPIDMEKEQILDCAQMLNTLDQGKLVERHQWIDTGMPIDVALQVCADDSLYQFFHESTKLLPLGLLKFFSSVTFGEYLPTLRIKEMELLSSPITVATFVNLVTLLHLEKITRIAFKKILNLLLEGVTESPEMIVSRLNLHRKNDMVEVERVCLQVIEENPKASRDFKKGKEKVLSLLVAKADQLLNHRVDTAILEDFYRRNC